MGSLGPIDVALLNPPRKGCDPHFIQALAQRTPERILYISCEMSTLARDMQLLTEKGYQLCPLQPFDMFPQTMHVECLALLTRTNPHC